MTIPLIILAVLATFGGFLGIPHFIGGHVLPNYLDQLLEGVVPESLAHGTLAMEWGLMAISVIVAVSCLYISKLLFLKKPEAREEGPLFSFLFNSYYLNEFYEAVIVRPVYLLSVFLWRVVDVVVIDGAVLLTAKVSRFSGRTLRVLHTGRLEHYLTILMLGMLIFLALTMARFF
jgi:NADH-quinone oxidoreductase subunit L